MKISLKLFAKTFQKVPLIEQRVDLLKKSLRVQYLPYYTQQTASLMWLSNLVYKQVAEIQCTDSLAMLDHFQQTYDTLDYDYLDGSFVLTKKAGDTLLTYHVRALDLEKLDHPFTRQTLYFRELKDTEKYVKITHPPGIPKFWKKIQRSYIEDCLLDKENPLGIPDYTQPLRVSVTAKRAQKEVGFELSSKLGSIRLVKAYNIVNDCKYKFPCKVLDESMQNVLFQFVEQEAGLTLEQFHRLSKLGFVGGQVRKTEFLLNLLEEMGQGIREQAVSSGDWVSGYD